MIIKTISHLEGKKIINGKIEYYKQEFFKQFYTHFASIKKLNPGIEIIYKGKADEITASASILVLLRACLENYSMFYYIYRESDNQNDIYFKFWSWFREGFINRQKLISKYHKDKKEDEKMFIEKLTNELKEYSIYNSFTNKQQKQYLKDGKWYFIGKKDLLELSGFSKPMSVNCYNYFSSYTHPTSASIMQTSQADFKDSKQITHYLLKALFISSGFYLNNYSMLFDEIKDILNDKDNEFILSWCELGKEIMT